MVRVLEFSNPDAAVLANSGGKGANLAKLTQAGFPVPGGIIVTADAYQRFITSADHLTTDVRALDFGNASRLVDQCREIREQLVSMELPESLQAALVGALPALLEQGPVSVRSSSTKEDLAGSGVRGPARYLH